MYAAEFPRIVFAGNLASETMRVEEWANCRRGHLLSKGRKKVWSVGSHTAPPTFYLIVTAITNKVCT